jgi:hypothetical protein
MATIVIKDLQENTELDRQAMLAISGGARFRAGIGLSTRPHQRRTRLFEAAPGVGPAPTSLAPGVARNPTR